MTQLDSSTRGARTQSTKRPTDPSEALPRVEAGDYPPVVADALFCIAASHTVNQ